MDYKSYELGNIEGVTTVAVSMAKSMALEVERFSMLADAAAYHAKAGKNEDPDPIYGNSTRRYMHDLFDESEFRDWQAMYDELIDGDGNIKSASVVNGLASSIANFSMFHEEFMKDRKMLDPPKYDDEESRDAAIRCNRNLSDYLSAVNDASQTLRNCGKFLGPQAIDLNPRGLLDTLDDIYWKNGPSATKAEYAMAKLNTIVAESAGEDASDDLDHDF